MNTYKITAIITRSTTNGRQLVNFKLKAKSKQDAEQLAPVALKESMAEDFKDDYQDPFKNIIKTEFVITETHE